MGEWDGVECRDEWVEWTKYMNGWDLIITHVIFTINAENTIQHEFNWWRSEQKKNKRILGRTRNRKKNQAKADVLEETAVHNAEEWETVRPHVKNESKGEVK